MKVTHLRVTVHHPFAHDGNGKRVVIREELWCRERREIPAGARTTQEPKQVTCKQCIALGIGS